MTTDRTSHALGTRLHPNDRAYVLHTYVHRSTKPGGEYPQQFADDQDWLAHTYFRVRADGRLDARCRACLSYPTWPHNPELRREVAP